MTREEITKLVETEVDRYVAAFEKEQNKLTIKRMFEEAEKKNKLDSMKKHIKEVFKNYKVIQKKRDYLTEHLGNITINKSSPIARLKIERTSKTNKPFRSEFDLILDKEDMLKDKIEEYNTFLGNVDNILNLIENKEIVMDRYINKMTIDDISIKYKMEDREVKRRLRISDDSLLVFFFPMEIFEVM